VLARLPETVLQQSKQVATEVEKTVDTPAAARLRPSEPAAIRACTRSNYAPLKRVLGIPGCSAMTVVVVDGLTVTSAKSGSTGRCPSVPRRVECGPRHRGDGSGVRLTTVKLSSFVSRASTTSVESPATTKAGSMTLASCLSYSEKVTIIHALT
jgi:hypothetical protein